MYKQPVRLGLIGAGRIGKLHAEHIAYRIDHAELTAIADINSDAVQSTARRFGIEHTSTVAQDVIDDPNVDAVIICSSTDTHADTIEAAARAGKDIFCEKPVDLDLTRIDQALKTVRTNNVKLQIGFNRRFDPNFHHIHQCIQEGEVGTLHLLRITSRDPSPPPMDYIRVSGGLFLDMTIHDFDMARYLVGSEVTSVFATGGVRVDPAIADEGDIDTAVVVLEFENGVIATIDNSRQAVYGYDQRVEAFGSKGMMWADNNTPHNTGMANRDGLHTPRPMSFFMDRYVESYVAEMQAFVGALLRDEAPPVGGHDGRAPVVLALAAKKSMLEHRPVRPQEVDPLASN
jgi:myo-inositol 2-dehydrogenase/D-chiro-inositol 1-dehydrogenase